MTKNKLLLTVILFTLTSTAPAMAAEEATTFREYVEKANNYIEEYQHFEASEALKKATKLGGAKYPSLHMRLGILYYGLGLIPEAIAEGEKAVALAPASKWYKYDLGKFYFVDKRYPQAKEQFNALLKIDPGFSLGYYYLAELFYHTKEYDMAWLSLQRARLLGHRGINLEEKLAPLTSKPEEYFEQVPDDRKLFRFIKLHSSVKAKKTLAEIKKGKLFENLEIQLKKKPSNNSDFGLMMLSELQAPVADSLRDSKPYSSPVLIKTDPDYRIMQRIMPFDPASWQAAIVAAPQKAQKKQAEEIAATTEPNKGMTSVQEKKADGDTIAPEEKPVITQQSTAPPEQKLSTKLAALYALESWQGAWKAQDVDAYLATYSNFFNPEGDISLEAWKKKRKRSLSRPIFIRIDIKDSVFEMISSKQMVITFKQSYESDTYHDEVIKTLTMKKEEEGWKITKEREIEKLAQ